SVLAQTVTETPVPTDWTLDGYLVKADPNGTATCSPTEPGYTGTSASITADTNNYLVCIKNHYTAPFVPAPAIDTQKGPDPQTIVKGDTATFTITVTNTGNVTLTNVTVTDALAPGCASSIGTMLAGAVVTYPCTVTNVQAGFTNSATATGTPPTGPNV